MPCKTNRRLQRSYCDIGGDDKSFLPVENTEEVWLKLKCEDEEGEVKRTVDHIRHLNRQAFLFCQGCCTRCEAGQQHPECICALIGDDGNQLLECAGDHAPINRTALLERRRTYRIEHSNGDQGGIPLIWWPLAALAFGLGGVCCLGVGIYGFLRWYKKRDLSRLVGGGGEAHE